MSKSKSKQSRQQPSDLELQILSILWEQGPLTVRAIREALPDGKQRAYTSVLSVVQVMEKKGLVKHEREREGLAHVFQPVVSRKQVLGPMLRGMVRKVFGGSPAAAVQQLLTETEADPEEIRQLRRFLDEMEQDESKQ